MAAGDKLSPEIARKLGAADIFVALMSPEYIASRRCQLEYNRAMDRRTKGLMRVVVVMVRPCAWKDTAASPRKVLAHDGPTLSVCCSTDHDFADVAEVIEDAVGAVRTSLAKLAPVEPHEPARSAPAPNF